MTLSILQYFFAPKFDDEAKQRRAGVINSLLLVALACALLFILAGVLSEESKIVTTLVATTAAVVIGALKVTLNRGFVRQVGSLLLLVTWVSFTIPMCVFDGIRDSALTGYYTVIAMAGLMVGIQILVCITIFIYCSIFSLYFAERAGLIVSSLTVPPDPLDLVTIMITLGVTALVIGAAMRLTNEAYRQVRNNELRLSKSNHRLELALAQVKTLSGLLPICAHCKKIRDDSGYWNQIESYIHDHSDAEFSHSVCPDCLAKHYPDLNIDQ